MSILVLLHFHMLPCSQPDGGPSIALHMPSVVLGLQKSTSLLGYVRSEHESKRENNRVCSALQ